jgi:4a-hydroxytetrahydrobiopterin dehydratase
MPAAKLTEEQITTRLNTANGWTRAGDSIQKMYTLGSFAAALVFVGAVGHLAEAADHHPDILVQYKKVTLTLSTHSASGLTENDFALAAQIDALPFRKS